MKKCPFCAEEIQDAAIVCKHCGRDLSPQEWYVKINDQQVGPLTAEAVKEGIKAGTYPPDARVKKSGEPYWRQANLMKEFGVSKSQPKSSGASSKLGCLLLIAGFLTGIAVASQSVIAAAAIVVLLVAGVVTLFVKGIGTYALKAYAIFFTVGAALATIPSLQEKPEQSGQQKAKRHATSKSAKSEAGRPREGGSKSKTFTLDDGSQLTVSNLKTAPKWACGTRQTGQLKLPNGQSGGVSVYYDNDGELVSINVLGRGNEKLYDNLGNRECLKNWKSGRMELLTDAEYKRYEKEARTPSTVTSGGSTGGCEPIGVGNEKGFAERVCKVATEYGLRPREVHSFGAGGVDIFISEVDARSLRANRSKLRGITHSLTEWAKTNYRDFNAVEITIVGNEKIAKGSKLGTMDTKIELY